MNSIPIELLIASFDRELSPEEQSLLDKWLSESAENREQYNELMKVYRSSRRLRSNFEPDAGRALAKVNHQLKVKRNIRLVFQSAAAVLLLLLASQFILRMQFSTEWKEITAQQRQVIFLPDSTKVILAPNSTLNYPAEFKGNERKIRLTGTAYFEVKPNPRKPFQIKMPDSRVKVLGTKFMIENDLSGDEKVLVDEGKVAFSAGLFFLQQEVILTKNEIGTWNGRERSLSETKNPEQNANTWLSGRFSFDELPLSEVLKTLENHFNIPIDLQDENFKTLKYSGQFTDQQELSYILQTISLTLNLSLEKTPTSYIIRP